MTELKIKSIPEGFLPEEEYINVIKKKYPRRGEVGVVPQEIRDRGGERLTLQKGTRKSAETQATG